MKRSNHQFSLGALFVWMTMLAVTIVVIQIGSQAGVFSASGMAAIGCLGLLGLIQWLLLDHSMKIESGQRQNFDPKSVTLFLLILGLVFLFMQLLPVALRLVLPR